MKELDALMEMLAEKRRRAEQEEAEMNMEILVDFLERARDKKQAELDEVCPPDSVFYYVPSSDWQ